MKQAELSMQLGLTDRDCRCGSTIAGSRTGKLCQPRLLGRLKDCKCVTGNHTFSVFLEREDLKSISVFPLINTKTREVAARISVGGSGPRRLERQCGPEKRWWGRQCWSERRGPRKRVAWEDEAVMVAATFAVHYHVLVAVVLSPNYECP